jgi:NADH-quinone oxidoreductase subunit N
MLMGVLVYSQLGIQSVLFYASIYLFMNFAAFFLIALLARSTGNEEITAYKGMGMQYPLVGVLMVVVMIALTGLPPTAGFTAKLLIFSALWEQYQQTENLLLIYVLLLGLLNTVVALFYYLKIPFFMFFRQASPSEKQMEIGKPAREPLRVTPFEKILAVLLIFPLILLFFKPDWIFNFITHISLVF